MSSMYPRAHMSFSCLGEVTKICNTEGKLRPRGGWRHRASCDGVKLMPIPDCSERRPTRGISLHDNTLASVLIT